ncbi:MULTISPECIES: methyltransferase domain-containing protein [unclassified Methanoregula]|uniref:methyltransferase domain-containing protein n=1 Tax=unclassified Methanoregula TaxID=2649730 RepID=UPI0009C56C05|nr:MULTISPECIES: methyltransferase domain-containing protein [unclassified Methanoregula]OPX65129.1 MAG: ubiquinone/menaquinone biosynthesis methyltransferase [Methanoregula sp. PtaB.Bin085]OPY32041.1 MAG: ubiquinone/menaquinone biosynthesis methyltransferase [Methanoregula sp. PtaU1.Bin006]
MPDYDAIKKHWDDLSVNEGSYKASWDDFYMLQKELSEICRHIQGNESICDIGCNNGYCDFRLLSQYDKIQITGIDFSEKLISEASTQLEKSGFKGRASFFTGNILNPDTFPQQKFDLVLIKRVLINLLDENDQILALKNVQTLLNSNGRIILSEAIEENWERLNRLRREFGLEELKQPWHNRYLSKSVIDFIYTNFEVETDDDYSSSYYIISRVFHPWIKKINNDKQLEYVSEINRMASMVPNFGDYGTQRLLILSLKEIERNHAE